METVTCGADALELMFDSPLDSSRCSLRSLRNCRAQGVQSGGRLARAAGFDRGLVRPRARSGRKKKPDAAAAHTSSERANSLATASPGHCGRATANSRCEPDAPTAQMRHRARRRWPPPCLHFPPIRFEERIGPPQPDGWSGSWATIALLGVSSWCAFDRSGPARNPASHVLGGLFRLRCLPPAMTRRAESNSHIGS